MFLSALNEHFQAKTAFHQGIKNTIETLQDAHKSGPGGSVRGTVALARAAESTGNVSLSIDVLSVLILPTDIPPKFKVPVSKWEAIARYRKGFTTNNLRTDQKDQGFQFIVLDTSGNSYLGSGAET